MSQKITKRVIDSAVPEPGKKDSWLWDTEIKGFGLRVTRAGSKSYIYKYREGKGRKARTRMITLGRPPMTAEQARNKALEASYQVQQGQSPAEVKTQAKEDLYFREVKQLYYDRHASVHLKPSTIHENMNYFWPELIKWFGHKRLNDITREDIRTYHLSLKKTPYTGNRKLALLSKVFNLCEEWDLRPQKSNPCYGIKKYKEYKRQRYLTLEELKRLNEVLYQCQVERSESPHFIALIKLLIITGCRRSEIMHAKWEHVSVEQKWLELPDSKTGGRVVYLSDPAIEILKQIPRLEDNPYIICSNRRIGKPFENPGRPWSRVREKAGIPDVRIHDLRHTFASIGAQAGLSLQKVGSLLGHRRVETTNGYAHLFGDPLRKANNEIGNILEGALAIPEDRQPEKIVNIRSWKDQQVRQEQRRLIECESEDAG